MGRLLKLVGIVIGALVLLFIAVAVGLALFVNPNDYKGRIEAAVAQATGRKLVLEGDLKLHVFPALRISVGSATLGNAPGFGDGPFAQIQGASLSVRLLPLLARRIEVGEVQLQGLVLNLERNTQGRDNWQDLGGSAAAAPPGALPKPGSQSSGSADVNLDIDELRIVDSQVKWSDATTGSKWALGSFDLTASNFGPNVSFPVSTDFTLKGQGLNLAVGADTRATVSLAQDRYRLDNLHLKLAGDGPSWPGGQGQANLSFGTLAADLKAQTLVLDDLTASFLGVTAKGSLKGQNLLGDLALSGRVQIQQFDPGAVLAAFGTHIKTADPGVLKRANAEATFVYDAKHVGLDDMKLALDDSALTGSVAVQSNNALRFDLAVDHINADRYLPPAEQSAAKQSTAAPSSEGSLDAVDLPAGQLKALDASGKLTIGKAQFAGLTLSDALVSVAAAGGHAEIKPSAKLYGGDFTGDVKLDVDGDAVKLAYVQKLTGVDMLPLGRDLLDSQMVSGKGSVNLNLTSRGSNVGQMRRALDGDVSLAVTNGALEGLDLWYELRRARAVLKRTTVPAKPEGMPRTSFSSVSATGIVKNAVLTTKDLNATTQFMKVDGSGTVNLLTSAIAFDLVAAVVDSPALKADPLMADLAGEQLPLDVGGSIEAPTVKPDFASLAKAKAKQAVEEREQAQKKQLEQKKGEAQDKLEQQKEEAKEKLRNRLRGLLDR
ncbi:MAG TPA: AsmA family protein [Gammaproteobacteria bacterium]|nr:AsmA family protein [Gammaproteobacteria bacterium]